MNTPRSTNKERKLDFHEGHSANTVSQLLLNFERFSPEQKEEIKSVLKELSMVWKWEYEKPYRSFDPNNMEELADYLDILTVLYTGGELQQRHAKREMLSFIKNAKISADKGEWQPIDRILFLQHPEYIYDVTPEYWDKINEANNVDIWDEDGNGGYYEKIEFPWPFGHPDAGKFCSIHVTENKLTNRPNAVIVIITARLRQKFSFLQWQYFQPNAVKFFPEDVEKAWDMTDKQVYDQFALPDID